MNDRALEKVRSLVGIDAYACRALGNVNRKFMLFANNFKTARVVGVIVSNENM